MKAEALTLNHSAPCHLRQAESRSYRQNHPNNRICLFNGPVFSCSYCIREELDRQVSNGRSGGLIGAMRQIRECQTDDYGHPSDWPTVNSEEESPRAIRAEIRPLGWMPA